MLKKSTFLLINLLLLTSSCGWRFTDYSQSREKTVSIPYVEGDSTGTFTAELAQQLESLGSFTYVPDGGKYTLQVVLLDSKSQNIGFRFNPHQFDSGIKKQLIPDETRRRLLAKVTLIEAGSQKTVLGPAYIVGQCDFDHENYSLDTDINRFSLGQLTDVDTTYEAVFIPLHRSLARNICQYLENQRDVLFVPEIEGEQRPSANALPMPNGSSPNGL